MNELKTLLRQQLDVWDDARQRFTDLQQVQRREVCVHGAAVVLQHNPGRMLSTNADMKKILSGDRPCFLCSKNRPDIQESLSFAEDFEILINPYPILSEHFTIALNAHEPQRILSPLPHRAHAFEVMTEWIERYPDYTIIYNGDGAGASAPDHLHLQAGNGDLLPLCNRWKMLSEQLTVICTTQEADAVLCRLHGHCCNGFVITYTEQTEANLLFNTLYSAIQKATDTDREPPMNIVAWQEKNGKKWICVFPRRTHRPSCFYAEGDNRRLISPGALDMAGLMTVPRDTDYTQLTAEEVTNIYDEVCADEDLMQRIIYLLEENAGPHISVGLMQADTVNVHFNAPFQWEDSPMGYENTVKGAQTITVNEGKLLWNGRQYDALHFIPKRQSDTFTLDGVTIGKQFHWQRDQQLTFEGQLSLQPTDNGQIEAVNTLPLERYLCSVISSEMSAEAPLELLKAHAIIARSWAMRIIEEREKRGVVAEERGLSEHTPDSRQPNLEHIRWYDNEGHTTFDVCADDHCQRYQGVGRITNGKAIQAVRDTCGLVLTYEGDICDTRYSKCCGGRTEHYETCWDDNPKPYLVSVDDCDEEGHPFCQTDDSEVLRQVLNDYDRETTDFFEWTVRYTAEELSAIVSDRLGRSLGTITDLIPLQRGPGGRIIRLHIKGTEGEVVVGKELEIRRILSKTHLYSAWFDVEKQPSAFILHGRGWGHGVGLCQIGAAMMAHRGYTFEEILEHYYRAAQLSNQYTRYE